MKIDMAEYIYNMAYNEGYKRGYQDGVQHIKNVVKELDGGENDKTRSNKDTVKP